MSSFGSEPRNAIALDTPWKRAAVLGCVSVLSIFFLFVASREFLASHYASKADLASLQRAIRLSPGNAEYRLMLGRYLWATGASPRAAANEYRAATSLNPHDADAWFELAGAAQVLEDVATQGAALQQAVMMDPTTPELAWQAGSFFLVQGD